MSSDQRSADLNLGRTNIHADLGITRAPHGTNIVGTQPLVTGAPLVTGTTAVTGVTTVTSDQQSVLIANEPKSVVMQEQRIASNIPITTEKHITREFIPVVHEEMVTRVPIVTGQAVHTGTAIAGEKYVQQVGQEVVRQQAATKIDVIPEVQTTLGVQEVINVPVSGVPQMVGKATVLSGQTLQTNIAQSNLQQTGFTTQTGLQQGFASQTGFATQTPLVSGQYSHTHQQLLPGQTLGTNIVQPVGTSLAQPLIGQQTNLLPGQTNLLPGQTNLLPGQTNLLPGQNLQGNIWEKEKAAQELNAAANLTQQAARDIRKI